MPGRRCWRPRAITPSVDILGTPGDQSPAEAADALLLKNRKMGRNAATHRSGHPFRAENGTFGLFAKLFDLCLQGLCRHVLMEGDHIGARQL